LGAQPFGKLILQDKRVNQSNAKGIAVITLKLVSEEGQSIFIKTYEKSPEENDTSTQEKPSAVGTNQANAGTQQVRIDYSTSTRFKKTMLDANKMRGLVNILPENLNNDLCFLFIADVMDEIERSGATAIDGKAVNLLFQRWEKHRINVKDIEKAVKVILEY